MECDLSRTALSIKDLHAWFVASGLRSFLSVFKIVSTEVRNRGPHFGSLSEFRLGNLSSLLMARIKCLYTILELTTFKLQGNTSNFKNSRHTRLLI